MKKIFSILSILSILISVNLVAENVDQFNYPTRNSPKCENNDLKIKKSILFALCNAKNMNELNFKVQNAINNSCPIRTRSKITLRQLYLETLDVFIKGCHE